MHKKINFRHLFRGQRILPYEKVVDMNSMFLTPENNVFFEKIEFYSDLK